MADLFDSAGRRRAAAVAPLAERLRPASLDGFVGGGGCVAAGSSLRREIESGRPPSLLLWGPPGCGKTTLARLIAAASGYELVELSATATGVAALRDAVEQAGTRLGATGNHTLLFVDEIHRLDRRQQDALLHAAEQGRVTLVGATTENPGFHVTSALRSRCRLLALPGHDEAASLHLAERGAEACELTLADDAGALLVRGASGDGRRLLNTLEHAAAGARAAGRDVIEAADVAAGLGTTLPDHDRGGDTHFELLSALHKSLRGSDPDAAVYYVQRLLIGGEDPRVIARRLVAMASEDVGLADPRALSVALDALRAVEFLGLPEGRLALCQAAIYLALAPRSDAVYQAAGRAQQAVEQHGALPVPQALRNAPTDVHRSRGDGAGYVHPHDTPEGVPPTEHLPEALAGKSFYEPGARGAEVELARRMALIAERRDRARRGERPG